MLACPLVLCFNLESWAFSPLPALCGRVQCDILQCMARQLTVRIPDDLDDSLRLAEQKLQNTPSEIVRKALRQFLRSAVLDRHPADRVQDLIGSLDSRVPDLAERHRDYILESLRRGR